MYRWAIGIRELDKRSMSMSLSSLRRRIAASTNRSRHIDLKYMSNYFSVGCDALVTLNFHRQRNALFVANRLLNKLIYFKYGTIDTFLKECRTLTDNVELELDGKRVELPHLESIVVLNIPYWGGGVEPWNLGLSANNGNSISFSSLCGLGSPSTNNNNSSNLNTGSNNGSGGVNGEPATYKTSSISDGLVEVFGVYSSFHIAQLQVGLGQVFRIGQAKHVRIKLAKRFPMQIDGEPWEQEPAIIDIAFSDQKTMLRRQLGK